MTPFLAEANPDPNIAWNVILTIGVLVAIGANVFALFKSNNLQKRQVSFEFEPASKEEFDKHVTANKGDHDNIFSKLGGVERGLRGEFSTELKVVRSEMVEAARQLAALSNNAELLNQSMVSERSRLDREIERRRAS
jgi:hypothetical protein